MSVPVESSANGRDERSAEDCKLVREVLARVGDKWTFALLAVLGDKRMRFNELHRAVNGISQRMLIVTLRNLERDGLVVRMVYPAVPPRVEYEMSSRGRSLKRIIEPISAWILANRHTIEESRRRFDLGVEGR
jgi:DNA-binding HxlR family transcriptional regulator